MKVKRMISRIILALLISLSYSTCFGKDTKNEELNIGLPKDWKVGYSNISASEIIIELVHKTESVENWTKMVTIQKFPNPGSYDLETYMLAIKKGTNKKCLQLEVADVITSEQNGYNFIQKNFHCIKKIDNHQEVFNMKVIKGNDYLYVVQFAYKIKLSDEEYMEWAYYLKDVVVERIENKISKEGN